MKNRFSRMNPQQLSEQLCNKGKLACGWYHGSWHLLKSLGVVSTSAVHEKSITQLLKLALAQRSQAEILITGSTDETLLSIIKKVADEIGCDVSVTAIDICATPLAFMEHYANQYSLKLETCKTDIIDYKTEKRFDIILTHAFMGYFNHSSRILLVEKWQQLISEDGCIVTIQRVRPETSEEVVSFDDEQSENFVSRAIEIAKEKSITEPGQLKKIEKAAAIFSKKFKNYAINSREVLESLFNNSGLVFHTLEYHQVEPLGNLSGPSVPSNAEFAHIIAKKKGNLL